MDKNQNIWSSIEKVLIVINFKKLEQLAEYRSAIKEAGLNINDCFILAIVDNKKEKEALPEKGSVVFINEKEINLFGKLKNDLASEVLSRKFEAHFVFCELSKKIGKQLSKSKTKLKVGVNCNNDFYDINLSSESISPKHLFNFAKQTLEKIQ